MFVVVVMTALRPFRLDNTLGQGTGAAHAGGHAFLRRAVNWCNRRRIGSNTYIVLCLEMGTKPKKRVWMSGIICPVANGKDDCWER